MHWDIRKLLEPSLMTRGIFRTRKGWGDDDSVCVRYGDGTELEVPRIQYEALINNPPFGALPWQEGESQKVNVQKSRAQKAS